MSFSHKAIGALSMLLMIGLVAGHGTITVPAFRNNPTVAGGWCPYCQGSQSFCDPSSSTICPPPTPCWGATPGSTVTADKFPHHKDLKAPDGTPWVDPTGGPDQPTPLWCPGSTVKYRFYIYADHNGVYKWESQQTQPGKETEEGFQNFTTWRSINNDNNTAYYNISEAGNEKIPAGDCPFNSQMPAWSPEVPHCRDGAFAESDLTLPKDMKTGPTVIRWIWYGAMTTEGARVMGPEHSLFVNCLDVNIGTPEQCSKQSEAFTSYL